MPRHRLASEPRLKALEEWLGERDFGQEDERLLSLPETLGDRFEIDFGLARPCDAIEQHGVEALPMAEARLAAASRWSSLSSGGA